MSDGRWAKGYGRSSEETVYLMEGIVSLKLLIAHSP
jgi:hypothetical protein